MNLQDIYREEGFSGLKRLAEATGSDPQYLRQCATRWRGKRPSPELAWRLIEADPRLTFEAMYAPAPVPAIDRRTEDRRKAERRPTERRKAERRTAA